MWTVLPVFLVLYPAERQSSFTVNSRNVTQPPLTSLYVPHLRRRCSRIRSLADTRHTHVATSYVHFTTQHTHEISA